MKVPYRECRQGDGGQVVGASAAPDAAMLMDIRVPGAEGRCRVARRLEKHATFFAWASTSGAVAGQPWLSPPGPDLKAGCDLQRKV